MAAFFTNLTPPAPWAIYSVILVIVLALTRVPRSIEPLRYSLLALALAAVAFFGYLTWTGQTPAWLFVSGHS